MRTPRTEPRVPKSLPVRVWGLDGHGRPINQDAATLDISAHGARLGGLACWNAPGEIIAVRHGGEKARFRIVWVGSPGTAYAAQIGLQCVEAGKRIWGDALEVALTQAKMAQAAAAHAGANAPGLHVASVSPGKPAPVASAGGDQRRAARFKCSGGAKIHVVGSEVAQWATLSDISNGGCYIETTAPYTVDMHVEFSLDVCDYRIQGKGVVKIVHRNVGMGIEFKELTAESRAHLQHVLSLLAEPPRFSF